MPGLYIHIPFCDGKCPYCDFFSLSGDGRTMDAYAHRVVSAMKPWAGADMDSVYFGGGTPNLMGAQRLAAILAAVRRHFSLAPGAEITMEANPTHVDKAFFRALRQAGFNRLSMGMQSAHKDELRLLGRAHSPHDVANAVAAAQAAGFENISLDLMLALPGGNQKKLKESIRFAASLGVQHISSYILKVEEGTPFAQQGVSLPDDEETAAQYLACVEELARLGFAQYEISNFSRPGHESRHNLLYWQGEPYLGLGPGAHSFWGGRRFYFPRDLQAFLQGCAPVEDGTGGSFEEFAMLRLRLNRGLLLDDCVKRFGPGGAAAFQAMQGNIPRCPGHLLQADETSIRFTPEGFLVFNALFLRLTQGLPAGPASAAN